MMDAVLFLKERKRMCESHLTCIRCPVEMKNVGCDKMKNKNIPQSCEQNCRECQFAAKNDDVVFCHNSDITSIKCLFYNTYDEVVE